MADYNAIKVAADQLYTAATQVDALTLQLASIQAALTQAETDKEAARVALVAAYTAAFP